MRTSLIVRALCSAALLAVATAPPAASAATFATSLVTARVPHGHEGQDAGVDVAGATAVRLTASGALTSTFRACHDRLEPAGCTSAFSFARIVPSAATGTLVAAFLDRGGRRVSAWVAVGDAAYVAVPNGAARMILRVNGADEVGAGSYRVVTDVLSDAAGAAAPSAVRRALSTPRVVASGGQTTRADVQFVLRRLGFSDSPADVTTIYQGGIQNWIAAQLSPATIDDSAANAAIQPVRFVTGNATTDAGYDTVLERRIVQREVASKRQLLEKLTLHWLEHFAVSEDKVNAPGAMAHYEDTVRADALGNFATLVTDVAKEPAMLVWLDNNYNSGSNPVTSPPNENFGRELMQLYVLGVDELNADGSPVLDGTGLPIPAYTENDVKAAALAMTGFQTYVPYPSPTGDPRTFEIESFNPQAHAKGPYTVVGHSVPDPGNATVVDDVVASLSRNPTTAPFQVKELLQRLVTENPSPGYISRISAVWTATESDPNQIAKVVQAIALDPEFMTSRNSMIKEPIEYAVDAVRALGGQGTNPVTSSVPNPLNSVMNTEGSMAETTWYPPSVFSFYRPGDKDELLSNSLMLDRWTFAANASNAARITTTCATCDLNLDFSAYATASAPVIADRILDGLVDGGTPELRALLTNYLAGSPAKIPGALWIVLSSPEYEVN